MSKNKIAVSLTLLIALIVIILKFDRIESLVVDALYLKPEYSGNAQLEANSKLHQKTRTVERYINKAVSCEKTFAPLYKKKIIGGLEKPLRIILRNRGNKRIKQSAKIKGWNLLAELHLSRRNAALRVFLAKKSSIPANKRLVDRYSKRSIEQSLKYVPFRSFFLCKTYLQNNRQTLLSQLIAKADSSKNWTMKVSSTKLKGSFPQKIKVEISGDGTLRVPGFCSGGGAEQLFSISNPNLEFVENHIPSKVKLVNKKGKVYGYGGLGCSGLPKPAKRRVTKSAPLKYSLLIKPKSGRKIAAKSLKFVLKMSATQEEGKKENCLACPFGPYPHVKLQSKMISWRR